MARAATESEPVGPLKFVGELLAGGEGGGEGAESTLWTGGEGVCHRTCSPMRLGLSSANASDNWTSAKLRVRERMNIGDGWKGRA